MGKSDDLENTLRMVAYVLTNMTNIIERVAMYLYFTSKKSQESINKIKETREMCLQMITFIRN